jgi:adenine phosphoribosyltransferase
MDLKSYIREIPDFPKPGIVFRDLTTLLRQPEALRYTLDALTQKCVDLAVDYVIGIESRGFIFGAPIAEKLAVGFVPVRKPGKLPAAVHAVDYALEYGSDRVEIHQDALHSGSRVLVIDDVIATGGTAKATAELITKAGGEVAAFGFVVELRALEGRKHLPDVPIMTLVEY